MCNTAAIDEWNGASGMIFLVSIIISPLRSIKYIKQKCFQLQPQHCTIAAVCALLLLLVCCGPRKTAMRCQNNKKIKKQDNRIRLGFVICRDKSILPHAQIYELNCGHCNQKGSCFFSRCVELKWWRQDFSRFFFLHLRISDCVVEFNWTPSIVRKFNGILPNDQQIVERRSAATSRFNDIEIYRCEFSSNCGGQWEEKIEIFSKNQLS